MFVVVSIGFLSSSFTGSESDEYVTLSVGVIGGQTLEAEFIVTLSNEDQSVPKAAEGTIIAQIMVMIFITVSITL